MKTVECRVTEMGDVIVYIERLRDNPEDLLLVGEEDIDLPSDRFRASVIERRFGMEWNINNLCRKLDIDHTYYVSNIRTYIAGDGSERMSGHCRYEVELPYSVLPAAIDYSLEWYSETEKRERNHNRNQLRYSPEIIESLTDMVLVNEVVSDWGLYIVKDFSFHIDSNGIKAGDGKYFAFSANDLESPRFDDQMSEIALMILDEIRSRGFRTYALICPNYREISGGITGMSIDCDVYLRILFSK